MSGNGKKKTYLKDEPLNIIYGILINGALLLVYLAAGTQRREDWNDRLFAHFIHNWTNMFDIMVLILLSVILGMIRAVNHVIAEDEIFLNSKIRHWNPTYWLKGMSYVNKYKPGTNKPWFFGSTTFLVWTTDGWHLTNMILTIGLISAGFLSDNIYQAVMAWGIYLTAGHFTYEYLTK